MVTQLRTESGPGSLDLSYLSSFLQVLAVSQGSEQGSLNIPVSLMKWRENNRETHEERAIAPKARVVLCHQLPAKCPRRICRYIQHPSDPEGNP